MNHHDHVALLQKGIPQPGGIWADLGAGEGALTLALADLNGETGTISAVDRDGNALRRLVRSMQERFPKILLHTLVGDFERLLPLPALDGIVMANSLHFIRNKAEALARIRSYLKPEGRLLMVEYNSEQGNLWVPYPLAYPTWERLSLESGFSHTEKLAAYPSRFLREIYSAMSW
jgi:ubiquinone/menaquinone biosynthesis C-methylase UbiE